MSNQKVENQFSQQSKKKNVLLSNELNISAILENSKDSVWAIDASYEILYANKVFTADFLASFGVLLEPGINLLDALPESLREVWKLRYDRALNNEAFSFIDEIKLKHTSIYIEVFMNPIVVKGKVSGALFFGKDITHRKQDENALKKSQYLLTEAQKIGKMGGWCYDVQTKTMTFTDTIFEIYGKKIMKADEGLLNYHEEDRDLVWNAFSEAISKQKPYDLEVRFINAQGKQLYVRTIGKPVIKNGKVDKVYGTLMDITKQKKTELALIESEQKLKELNTAKDKFVSIIAHDLRSPFNHIIGFSDLLIENANQLEAEESKKYLNIINTSAKNTLVLLDNLLNWAKSQTEHLNFNPAQILFSNVIQETIELEKSLAKAKNISLNYLSADDITVYADEHMLKTILRNLISNAIKFTNFGGHVDICTVLKPDQVEITISDNGVGINKEKLNELFTISSKTTTLGTSEEKGSGFGLVLCKEFVEKHQGKIWVKSQEGKGSDFTFTLPFN